MLEIDISKLDTPTLEALADALYECTTTLGESGSPELARFAWAVWTAAGRS